MAAKIPPRPLVHLEEGTIAGMAANATYLKEFPFLAGVAKKAQAAGKAKCGSCGRGAKERSSVYGAAKQQFAGLDSDKKRRLKELLNAKQVRIIYSTLGGKVIKLTF